MRTLALRFILVALVACIVGCHGSTQPSQNNSNNTSSTHASLSMTYSTSTALAVPAGWTYTVVIRLVNGGDLPANLGAATLTFSNAAGTLGFVTVTGAWGTQVLAHNFKDSLSMSLTDTNPGDSIGTSVFASVAFTDDQGANATATGSSAITNITPKSALIRLPR